MEIKRQIKKIEKLIVETEITLLNYDFIDKLLDIHQKLWGLLYFKLNEEKDFLRKGGD